MTPVVFDDEGRPEPLQAVRDLSHIPVQDVDGHDAGEIFGALAEAGTGLVRYLDLAVARSDRHVLVPVGHVRFEEGQTGTRARLRAVTRQELLEIPAFEADYKRLNDEYHQAVLAAFGRFLYGERYYAHPSYDHSGLYAGEHPIVAEEGAAAPGDDGPTLHPISALKGYRVVRGEPDVTGWPVVTRGADEVGTVSDLLVDTRAMKVRYVVVGGTEDGAARLLPVGFLHIDKEGERVRAQALVAEDIPRLPAYEPGPVSRDEEDRLRKSLEKILSGSRRYDRPDFRPMPQLP